LQTARGILSNVTSQAHSVIALTLIKAVSASEPKI
jgi:hypothetical protein